MQYSTLTVAALSLLGTYASAKTILIEVGRNGASFSPASVTAAVGDILEYRFAGGRHSVVRADFSKGCTPASSDGFFSGFPSSGTVFQVTVTNTDPIFFYCSAGSHCQNGMVGVVNPSSAQTLDKFKSTARASKDNISPGSPFGGAFPPQGISAARTYQPVGGVAAVAAAAAAALT